MPAKSRARTPSRKSTRQDKLERAADTMWKDAAKTASAGAGALEDAARAVEMGEALDSAGQIMLASGIQDLTRAADLHNELLGRGQASPDYGESMRRRSAAAYC